ncbi:hypothetical protein [Streptomyces sp. NPDC054838]
MPSDRSEPIVLVTQGRPRTTNPENNEYLLYDEDFPVETNPKYQLADPSRPLRNPHFTLGEVSNWVFARDAEWIRRQVHARKRPLSAGGHPLTLRAVQGRGRSAERRLTLPDAERLAWALYERRAINGVELRRACAVLTAVADQYIGPKLLES